MSLEQWGWNESRASGTVLPEDWKIGRVISRGKSLYTVTDGGTAQTAQVSGAFGYRAVLPSDYPAAGDFVAFREEGGSRVIEQVLKRSGVLSRKAAGVKEEEQVLAANIDVVFLVLALEGERGFLPRLIERFLTLVMASGAKPVIILNKSDLADDPERFRQEAEAYAAGAVILCVSAVTGMNLDAVAAMLEPGKTFYFLGKSGVGKSSLINALFGKDVAKTGAVREDDSRGRHTTSGMELLLLPSGAILADTPGVREAALWADDEDLDDAFPEIAELAAACRFGDCSHAGEPGCAVQEALVGGSLDQQRYESYLDYQREVRYHRRASDRNAQRAEKLRWKKISQFRKDLYESPKHR